MDSSQKNKKHDPKRASEIANDQLGENAPGIDRANEIYKEEHTSKTKKR